MINAASSACTMVRKKETRLDVWGLSSSDKGMEEEARLMGACRDRQNYPDTSLDYSTGETGTRSNKPWTG